MKRREFLSTISSSTVMLSLSPLLRGFANPQNVALTPALKGHLGGGESDGEAALLIRYPKFDLAAIPFSRAGSYLTIGRKEIPGASRLSLSTIRKSAITYRYQTGPSWSHDLYDLVLMRENSEIPYTFQATPLSVDFAGAGVKGAIWFFDEHTLSIEVRGADLFLLAPRRFSWKYQASPQRFQAFDSPSGLYTNLIVEPKGSIAVERSAKQKTDGDCLLLTGQEITALLRLTGEEADAPDIQKASVARHALEGEFSDWMTATTVVPAEFAPAAKTAWFLFWNLQVAADGGYTRRTILSSKRSMSQIWSWDNCFNALAVAGKDPRLAWDQLFVILDHQRRDGLLPDTVNDLHPLFGFNKPPVWGWTITRLLPLTPIGERRRYVAEAYPKVAQFQRWWFEHRDLLGDGLPFYMNGNDSGWDNSTIFDDGWPVQAPDLTAHLILQAEGLATMAELLDNVTEADSWREQALRLTELFHRRFARDGELIYRVLTADGLEEKRSTSLLTRISVILGKRLAADVRARLVAELSDEKTFHAAAGPASESLDSPKYEPNGYWRGPVWGPSTLLIFDGLIQCGEVGLAREMARRFCRTCASKAEFRENYDAMTGAGQYDSGMTWSAADFLLLARVLQHDSTWYTDETPMKK